MRVLFLAPQPFFEERGTPLAVDRVLRELSALGHTIDAVVYHLGENVRYPGVRIHRSPRVPFVTHVRPGFSFKKLLCDVMLLVTVVRLARRHRYDVVHAVEESVFVALALRWLHGLPYVYDMDSSLSDQMREQHPVIAPLLPLMRRVEGAAVRRAAAVVPVCDALADTIAPFGPRHLVILPDVSLLDDTPASEVEDLRTSGTSLLAMYVGNLEPYQGIDLLIDSFAIVARQNPAVDLVVIGGARPDIERYAGRCRALGIAERVRFCGPRPVARLGAYLAQADILVSPRIRGTNTPMKVYSYLHSGRAVVATRLFTHTQVMDDDVAMLAEPTPEAFASAILALAADAGLRARLGEAATTMIEARHSQREFQSRLRGLYAWLEKAVGGGDPGKSV